MNKFLNVAMLVLLFSTGCSTNAVSVTPEEKCVKIFEEYDKSSVGKGGEYGLAEGIIASADIVNSYFDAFDKLEENDCTLKYNREELRVFYKDKLAKVFQTPEWMDAKEIDVNEYVYFPTRFSQDDILLDENTCCGHAN